MMEYMKTVLFVPGFKESLSTRDYESTINVIRDSGYSVEFVPINWNRTTVDDWLNELEAEYSKLNSKDTILAGFSFGAMTVFAAAIKQNPAELWLFSLSPYFSEDIHSKDMKKSWLNNIGHRRTSAFDKLIFKNLAKSIHCKTLIFAGEIEVNKWPGMKERALEANRLMPGSKLCIVKDVGHDVSDKRYINAIKQAI
jgi:pimeloyl-ACP methyl ester carboxylesterase